MKLLFIGSFLLQSIVLVYFSQQLAKNFQHHGIKWNTTKQNTGQFFNEFIQKVIRNKIKMKVQPEK